jgi:hypothetical protein
MYPYNMVKEVLKMFFFSLNSCRKIHGVGVTAEQFVAGVVDAGEEK